jgi:ubiquinone/menaquinone biosynthesis C-methylase UbiE/acyl carrier protein
MNIEGSYDISRFAIDTRGEVQRLNAQIDLFWKQEIALYQRLGLEDGLTVLDCGCGPGYLLEKLLALYPSLHGAGIEIDDQLMAIAKKTLIDKYPKRCSIFQQSITQLEFPDNSFDFVIARLVLEHLPDPTPALEEILRVLRMDGRAVFIDNDFDLHERTWPDSPALGDLYDAYRRARRSEGGNPCIGRQLPVLMRSAGFSGVDLQLLAAHSQVVGDNAFLKAEGSGIPAQLVKAGHLLPDSLNQIASQWRSMLTSQDHTIFRMLFAASGGKAEATVSISAEPLLNEATTAELATQEVSLLFSEPRSTDEIRQFIRQTLASEMGQPAEALATGDSLIHAGVDSMAAVTLCNRLETRLGITLTIAEILGGSSIDDLVKKIAALIQVTERPAHGHGITRQPRTEPIQSVGI